MTSNSSSDNTKTTAGHPIIICYGKTADADYPLILIVGREPNSDEPIADVVGTYNFKCSPYCGFWNASYALAASLVDMTPGQLKETCKQAGRSPLIYADAMPQGLLNATADKHRRREMISAEAVQGHVERIFQKPICNRVKLVILSGLRGNVFTRSRELLEAQCAERSIPLEHLPFFANQNAPSIRQALTAQTRQQMLSVLRTFLQVASAKAATS